MAVLVVEGDQAPDLIRLNQLLATRGHEPGITMRRNDAARCFELEPTDPDITPELLAQLVTQVGRIPISAKLPGTS